MQKPKILFIYPHPDDESFLSGGSIARYSQSGAASVYLCTLTRGEASRNAAFLGISPEQIAALRVGEVKAAAYILGIIEHIQADFPDGGLRDYDPRVLERYFEALIRRIEPQVLVTFDVQGGSGHPDHIVTHHTAKRVFVTLREEVSWLRRLCFTSQPSERSAHWPRKVFGLPRERIDAIIDVRDYIEIERRAILTHESVRRDFEEHNYDNWMLWEEDHYSFFRERFDPPIDDLLAQLPDAIHLP